MNLGRALATANVLLSVGACLGYLYARDWKHALYWFFAAGITATVTYVF